ncbi:MAG: hypothetical protein O3C01_08020, partial [Bacteroidetes bacterium]|nr:hypothetical protein [Bacteroidota bacterium]
SSGVERFLGKEEVVSSNLIVGSIIRMNIFFLNFSGFKNLKYTFNILLSFFEIMFFSFYS